MRNDYSAGIIPLKKKKRKWEVLLVQLHAGHWGFPKGHPDPGEAAKEAAERELGEETGMIVESFLSDTPLKESYIFYSHGERIHKTVDYFLALVKGELVVDVEEIKAAKWVPLDEADQTLTFPNLKQLCPQIMFWIRAKGQ